MRILSQDTPMINAFDIPYEMAMLSMSKYMEGRYRIYVQGTFIGNTSDDNFVLMAEYSTEAKVRKAMEMLREQYAKLCSLNTYLNVGMELFAKSISQAQAESFSIEYKNMNVFQFPQDTEIEV